jgi:hypothetical protein
MELSSTILLVVVTHLILGTLPTKPASVHITTITTTICKTEYAYLASISPIKQPLVNVKLVPVPQLYCTESLATIIISVATIVLALLTELPERLGAVVAQRAISG